MAVRPEQVFPLEIFDYIGSFADDKTFLLYAMTCRQLHNRYKLQLQRRRWREGIIEIEKIRANTPVFYEHLQAMAAALRQNEGKYYAKPAHATIISNFDYRLNADFLIITQQHREGKLYQSNNIRAYARRERPIAFLTPWRKPRENRLDNLYTDYKGNLHINDDRWAETLSRLALSRLRQGYFYWVNNTHVSVMVSLDVFLYEMSK